MRLLRFACLVALAPVATASSGTAGARAPVDACVPQSLRSHALSFRASDGIRLAGLELGKGAKGVVLAHELNASLCNWLPFARTLAARGFHVLLFDERGAGKSAFVSYPQSDQLHRDVLGAVRELRRRGAQRFVLGGASAGGTGALTAAPLIGKALAGVAALSSPATYSDLDAKAAVARVHAPGFFAVATADTRFAADVKALYQASPAHEKQLELVDGFSHGTELLTGREGASMRPKLLGFITAALRS